MSNEYDHYKETEHLIKLLKDVKLDDYGLALQSAMNQGSTGTEIFMALRWNLEKVLDDGACSELITKKAKRLWKELDRALQ